MSEITNEEEALVVVNEDGMKLQYVPENFKTPELCLAAVKEDGKALQYVPEKFMTEALCLENELCANNQREFL